MIKLIILTSVGVFMSDAHLFNDDYFISNDVSDIESEDGHQDCIDAHNKYRSNHGADPLKPPSADLQAYADTRGKELASTDNFAHPSKGSKYGENLFFVSGTSFNCPDAIKMWYEEVQDYNYSNPGFAMNTGHFTQVVWRDSKQVACAITKSMAKKGVTYIVCNYSPPGNYAGRYEQNVLPLGHV